MKSIPKILSSKVADMLRSAVDISGDYTVENNLFHFEEELTFRQTDQVIAFLTWVNDEGKSFGADIHDVYAEFRKKGQSQFDAVIADSNADEKPSNMIPVATEFKPRRL